MINKLNELPNLNIWEKTHNNLQHSILKINKRPKVVLASDDSIHYLSFMGNFEISGFSEIAVAVVTVTTMLLAIINMEMKNKWVAWLNGLTFE